MYEYAATVKRIIDGDTVDLSIDLGFDTYRALRVRLGGIDTPELHAKDPDKRAMAVAAAKMLSDLLPTGSTVRAVTFKDKAEKYGRYLALLFIGDDPVSVSQKLITAGLAVEYHGEKRV